MQLTTAAYKAAVASGDLVTGDFVTIQLPITQKNICPTPNFEDGLGSWAAAGPSGLVLSTSTVHAFAGTQSMRVDWGTGASFSGGPFIPIPDAKPGEAYIIGLRVWLDTNCPPVTLVNDDSGNTVSTKGSWQLLWGVCTPRDFSQPKLWIMPTASMVAGAGVGLWVDQVFYMLGTGTPTGAEYFDGDYPNCHWTGLPALSTSVKNVDPYPNLTGTVKSIRITRSFTTDEPPGSRQIDGYPTGRADIYMGAGIIDPTNDALTIAQLFDPDNTASVLYGIDPAGSAVTIQQGVYDPAFEGVTTFTGSIDEVVVDSITGEVWITAFDPMTKLRPNVSVPPIAYRFSNFASNPGLTALWPMDLILRQNGFYSSPPPRANCFLYASCHGSAWPEVYGPLGIYPSGYPTGGEPATMTVSMGGNNPTLVDPISFNLIGEPSDYMALMAPGKWSQQVVLNPYMTRVPRSDGVAASSRPNIGQAGLGSADSNTIYFEGWLDGDTTQDSTQLGAWFAAHTVFNNYARFNFDWAAGDAAATFSLDVARDSGFVGGLAVSGSLPLDGNFHHVSVLITWTGSTTATVRVIIDTTTTTTAVTGIPADGGDIQVATADFAWLGYADTVQLTSEQAPQPYGAVTPWTPTAFLDASLNALVAIPDLTNQDAKTVLQQIAQAERGIVGFDELGVARFRNRNSIFQSTSGRTISGRTSLKAHQADSAMSAVATHISVPISTPALTFKAAPVWNASDIIAIDAFSTYSAIIATAQPTLDRQTPDSGYTGINPIIGTTYWRATLSRAGHTPVTSGISVKTYSITATTLMLIIENDNSFPVYMNSPDTLTDVPAGTPYLYIGGLVLTSPSSSVLAEAQWPDISDGGAAANEDYGDIVLPFSQNPFNQDYATGLILAQDTLIDTFQPKPLFTNAAFVYDPSLQLGDRVTVNDPDASGMLADVLLTNIDSTSSDPDWTMLISAVRISRPGQWIMGQVGASELGTSTYV